MRAVASSCPLYHSGKLRFACLSYKFYHMSSRKKSSGRTILSRFVVFEGIDGAGTTTQLGKVASYLKGRGHTLWETREPTDGPVGAFIRKCLASGLSFPASVYAYLFAADRELHVFGEEGVMVRVGRGEIVLCDRYLHSSLAYQSDSAHTRELVEDLNRRFPLPEAVIYLDTPVEECLRRLSERPQKDLFEQREVLMNVASRYREVLRTYEAEGGKVLYVDGTQPPDLIFREILKFLERTLDI